VLSRPLNPCYIHRALYYTLLYIPTQYTKYVGCLPCLASKPPPTLRAFNPPTTFSHQVSLARLILGCHPCTVPTIPRALQLAWQYSFIHISIKHEPRPLPPCSPALIIRADVADVLTSREPSAILVSPRTFAAQHRHRPSRRPYANRKTTREYGTSKRIRQRPGMKINTRGSLDCRSPS